MNSSLKVVCAVCNGRLEKSDKRQQVSEKGVNGDGNFRCVDEAATSAFKKAWKVEGSANK